MGDYFNNVFIKEGERYDDAENHVHGVIEKIAVADDGTPVAMMVTLDHDNGYLVLHLAQCLSRKEGESEWRAGKSCTLTATRQ